ncbi:MAG: hydantoinase/oxoprolinase family protein, partial [Nitrososphaerales archaeon]
MSKYRIGVDVGGTFTDALMIDDSNGEVFTWKVPSTPQDPSIGVMNSIPKKGVGILSNTQTFVHGTTIAENALIQRRGPRVGIIATKGQRDRIEIQRCNLLWSFDFYYRKPEPLVPRTLRKEVNERTSSDGTVLTSVDRVGLIRVAKELVDARVDAISILFLNSYANSHNEEAAGNIIRNEFPNVHVVTSSEVLPEILEYERFSATVLSAYLRPILEAYVDKMRVCLHEYGFRGDLMIMQANGGLMTSETAKKRSCLLIESGVAGGVVGTLEVCSRIGYKDIITFDMGGTTAKACLIRGGEPSINVENLKEGYPLNFPMIDIVSIGAGGGSLAWVDEQGGLHVGPQSAGAQPGPACYGNGGTEPTVTDAHVVLGTIDHGKFLGGDMKIYPELARQAVMKIAKQYDSN